MKVSLTPFFLAIYTNFLTKSANPKSLTLRPQSDFIPCRFKSSSRISSYSSVSWCASFQWKSARCRSILRCFRAKSSRARSRFFDFFSVRECAWFARLMALILRLKKLRRFYVVSIVTREIPFQTEIKACDFTRHDAIQVRFYIVGENADIDIADSVPFDCATFRSAQNITGIKVLVDTPCQYESCYSEAIPNPIEVV